MENSSQPTENPFLQGVDEADRPIVSKYINDWDAQTTQRFQALNNELKPWKDLGVDYDNVMNAVNAMMFAERDPVGFYNHVREFLEREGLMPGENMNNGQAPQLPEFEGLPDQFVSKFQSQEQELKELRQFAEEMRNERTQQSQQQQLDNLLSELETKHGKFDKHAVMARILSGMEPDDAVKDFQKYLKGLSSPEQRPTPPNTLGNGRAVRDQVDAKAIRNDPSKRKELVAQLLENIG